MANLLAEQLRRLPQRPEETWIAGIIPAGALGGNFESESGPYLAMWINKGTESMIASEPGPDHLGANDVALSSLVEVASDREWAGYRPGRIEVDNEGLARFLRERLEPVGIAVEVSSTLDMASMLLSILTRGAPDELQDELIHELETLASEVEPPSLFAARGMTLERVRAFAEAGKLFYETRPWEKLEDSDLIEIETPKAPHRLRLAIVMGAGGEEFGLGFFTSFQQYADLAYGDQTPEELRDGPTRWAVLFEDASNIASADVAQWREHDLPLAGAKAYPFPMKYTADAGVQIPSSRTIAYFEGLLRALADTTEAQLDAGRWETTVQTSAGEMRFTLVMPEQIAQLQSTDELFDLVAALGDDTVEASCLRTPLEEAEDIAVRAVHAQGWRRRQLLRQALEVCPDCAIAHNLLANLATNPQAAYDCHQAAAAAARRVLKDRPDEPVPGDYWHDPEAQPYVIAVYGMAQTLMAMDRHEEAIARFEEVLRLDCEDHALATAGLLRCLLWLDRNREAAKLAASLSKPTWPILEIGRIVTLLRIGDKEQAARSAQWLLKSHRNEVEHFAILLRQADDRAYPWAQDFYEQTGESWMHLYGEVWLATPGATEWLIVQIDRFHEARGKSRRRGRGRRKRRR